MADEPQGGAEPSSNKPDDLSDHSLTASKDSGDDSTPKNESPPITEAEGIPASLPDFLRREPPSPELRKLYTDTTRSLTNICTALSRQARRRLLRYQITRILVVFLMFAAITIVLLFNYQKDTLDIILTRVTPIIMMGALFFYVIQAFLRDYEVSLQTAREADKITSTLRDAQLSWVT